MASGKIRDFTKPDPEDKPAVRILSQVSGQPAHVEPPEQHVEVTVHEEVIREGQDQPRVVANESGIEIRMRTPKDKKKWEAVKRGEDQ